MRCPRSRLANGVPGGDGAPLPGTKTRCQELADGRGWSTFRKRGPYAVLTPLWRAERRPHASRGACGLRKKCRASSARHTLGFTAEKREGRLTRGRTNNTGGEALAGLFWLSRHPEEAA